MLTNNCTNNCKYNTSLCKNTKCFDLYIFLALCSIECNYNIDKFLQIIFENEYVLNCLYYKISEHETQTFFFLTYTFSD